MAKPRNSQALGEFAQLNSIGAAILGMVTRQGENSNGRYVIFEPAGYRPDADTPFTRFAELACGLRTDLASKVTQTDTGKILAFVLVATKETAKSPMKIFNVYELTTEEARAIMVDGRALPAEWMTPPDSVTTSATVTSKAAAPSLF